MSREIGYRGAFVRKKLEEEADRCVSTIAPEASIGHRAFPGSLEVDS